MVIGMGNHKAEVVALLDYILGELNDARRNDDWDRAISIVKRLRERLYYDTIDRILTSLGL